MDDYNLADIATVTRDSNSSGSNDGLFGDGFHISGKGEYETALETYMEENLFNNQQLVGILAEAEKEAMRRGCHHVHVDTMSWQAPEFYKKHGYEVIGVIPDIPSGNQKYLLMKAL